MRPIHIRRRTFLGLAGAALLAGAAPAVARKAAALTRLGGSAFGTGWSVSLPADAPASGLRERLDTLLGELDAAFSPWRADSVLARFNAGKFTEYAVSDEIVNVARSALRIAEASGGRFDPTVGPLVARFGFGPIHDGRSPAEGWRGIKAGSGHLAKSAHGLTLDLCGIAKGHALDRMAALLLDAGQDSFLVDLGGELAARGRHPSGRAWHVGIEDPRPGGTALAELLRLDGMAVATSGDRANGYDLGGRRYSHIIDPATHEPVFSDLASVSVVMATAREADGWATALMAAGAEGPAVATANGVSALFLFRDGDDLRPVTTGSIGQHLVGAA